MFVLSLVLIIITCLYADIFKFDPDFLENEDKYKEIKRGKYSLIIHVYCSHQFSSSTLKED